MLRGIFTRRVLKCTDQEACTYWRGADSQCGVFDEEGMFELADKGFCMTPSTIGGKCGRDTGLRCWDTLYCDNYEESGICRDVQQHPDLAHYFTEETVQEKNVQEENVQEWNWYEAKFWETRMIGNEAVTSTSEEPTEEPEDLIGAHCDAQGQCGALTCMTYNPVNGGFAPASSSNGICMDVVGANGICNINQVACQPTQICANVVEESGLGRCEDSGPAMGTACSGSGDCGVLNGSSLVCQTYDNDGTWSPAADANGTCFDVADFNEQCDIANVSCPGSLTCKHIVNGLGTCLSIAPPPPTPGQSGGVHYATHRDPAVPMYAPERIGGKGAISVYGLLWNPDFPNPRPY